LTDFHLKYSLKSEFQKVQNLTHKHSIKNTVHGKEHLQAFTKCTASDLYKNVKI
jgi:hypothetical protein